MNIQLKYFASIRETMARGEELVQTNAKTIEALQAELISKGSPYDQALAWGKAVRVALNQELVSADVLIQDGDEVAFFPPVTGG
jgi:molybdopterin synthase sulfur carrier subunit